MLKKIKAYIFLHKLEILFLSAIYALGVYFRLAPRLQIDPHLLTLNADIWERLAIAQYFKDHAHLPEFCLRYIAYGQVPFWYPPVSPILFAVISWISQLDIATVSSRIIPFIEALSPLTIFFLGRMLFNKRVGYLAAIFLSLTPSFIYWSGISSPQSLTLFLMPLYIMLLIWRGRQEDLSQKKRMIWFLGLGALLAVNFLTHLSYFLALIMLLFVVIALMIERKARKVTFIDFIAAIIVSQLLTIWWWSPKVLYWWWVKALVTSSGLYTTVQHLKEYGFISAILSIYSVLFLLGLSIFWRHKRKPYMLLLFFWALLPFLETQNETILKLVGRFDLSWSTIFKPLEGFRFYCFLAQPFSIMSAVVISEYCIPLFKKGKKVIVPILFALIITVLIIDIHTSYKWYGKIQNAGITKQEYAAAVWFRENSEQDDRIVADYYRVQMFAGVCGGKSLLGGLFPLRNVDLSYISMPAVVQENIYVIYQTRSAKKAHRLMRRYGCTHIFYSKNMIKNGALGSKYKQGFGVDIDEDKFKDRRFFQEVYNYKDDVIIIRAK